MGAYEACKKICRRCILECNADLERGLRGRNMEMRRSNREEENLAAFKVLVQATLTQPIDADWERLWQSLERVLENLSQDEILKVAGDAIVQLAEICMMRAGALLDGWQSQYHSYSVSMLQEEPILPDELLAGVLRHTMTLNLEELLEEVDPQRRFRRSEEDSLVGNVEKHVVLEMVEQIELKQAALQPAYEESISAWSTTVRQWIETQPQPIGLNAVLNEVNLLPVQTWLGLLLSDPGYQWEHQWKTEEEFYCPRTIKVRMISDDR